MERARIDAEYEAAGHTCAGTVAGAATCSACIASAKARAKPTFSTYKPRAVTPDTYARDLAAYTGDADD